MGDEEDNGDDLFGNVVGEDFGDYADVSEFIYSFRLN